MTEDKTNTLPYHEAKRFLKKLKIYFNEGNLNTSASISPLSLLRVKKHYFVTLMRENGVLDTFLRLHWKRGLTNDGERVLKLYERVNAENNDVCHIEQNAPSSSLASNTPLQTVLNQLDDSIQKSLKLSASQRQKRLSTANIIPDKIPVLSIAYRRNPDVIAEVLLRANGKCEACKAEAPFKRSKDGSPYLEVHHKKQLSLGGEDTVRNAIAVCPNCHRKAHFGA